MTTLRCSFCNKAHKDVAKLVAGPEVFICDECVGLCVEIMRQEGVVPAAPARKELATEPQETEPRWDRALLTRLAAAFDADRDLTESGQFPLLWCLTYLLGHLPESLSAACVLESDAVQRCLLEAKEHLLPRLRLLGRFDGDLGDWLEARDGGSAAE